ncbi:MAG: DUF3298 domain-containing protein [Bacteroidaceae bacterium]|nr:DUF3298 domain-containing protein [Bacteroidaceae bacterium]
MNRKLAIYVTALFITTSLSCCKESSGWSGMDFVKVQDSIKSPYDIAIDMEFANGKNPEQQKIANAINAKLQDIFLEKVDTTNLPSPIKEYIGKLCETYKREDEEFHLDRSDHLSGHFEYGLNGIINYILTEDYYGGGAHPTTITNILCFNTETGEQITTDRLVMDSCRHKLIEKLTMRLMENVGVETMDSLRKKGYLDMTDMFISDNFKLGTDSVSFLYNPYDIAPYALGSSTISFAYEELKGIINFSNGNE